jgi:hypothetical protein
MTELPSSVDNPTMVLAIAWKIVEIALSASGTLDNMSPEDKVKRMTDLFTQARNGILK